MIRVTFTAADFERSTCLTQIETLKMSILSAAAPRWGEEEAFAKEGVCFVTAGY